MPRAGREWLIGYHRPAPNGQGRLMPIRATLNQRALGGVGDCIEVDGDTGVGAGHFGGGPE